MNTVKKGDLFEQRTFQIINTAIQDKRLGLDAASCKVLQKPNYYSKDREGDIIFDISIEVWPAGATRCHLLYLIECKDYHGSVPASDIEEFLHKLQQVAGHFVKAVFVTTGSIQEAGLKLLQNRSVMLIKIDEANDPEFLLYNKPRNSAQLKDGPVSEWQVKAEQLAEIRKRYENGASSVRDWDHVISMFLKSELSAKINWEHSDEKVEGLEYLSKKLIADLTVNILNEFEGRVVYYGQPLPLERFMAYLTKTYGLKFVTQKPFTQKKAHLNGYYDQGKKIIHINPEINNIGLHAFVCAHEIGHFFLHEGLKMSQGNYDSQENSTYDPITKKYLFKKEKHWIEWQANYFAGCLLMPRRSMLWQLIQWQDRRGLSRKGYIWVDHQPCNILDYKVAITQLAYIFQVSRSIFEIRLRELGLIKYEKDHGYNGYSLFGNQRPAIHIGRLVNRWLKKLFEELPDVDDLD